MHPPSLACSFAGISYNSGKYFSSSLWNPPHRPHQSNSTLSPPASSQSSLLGSSHNIRSRPTTTVFGISSPSIETIEAWKAGLSQLTPSLPLAGKIHYQAHEFEEVDESAFQYSCRKKPYRKRFHIVLHCGWRLKGTQPCWVFGQMFGYPDFRFRTAFPLKFGFSWPVKLPAEVS